MIAVLPIHATAPGGPSRADPVGGPVAGSSKSVGVHQGFQQQWTMAITARQQEGEQPLPRIQIDDPRPGAA